MLVDITEDGVAILDELLPSPHRRERVVMQTALTAREQRALLGLLAKLQAVAQTDAAAETYHDAPRRKSKRPKRRPAQ